MKRTTANIFRAFLTLTFSSALVSESNSKGGNSSFKEDNSQDEMVTVMVHVQQAVNTITSHYVGVAFDASHFAINWTTFDFASQKVRNLGRGLAPSYFRMGGTYADLMTYVMVDGTHQKRSLNYSDFEPFNLTSDQWVTINEFVRDVGWDFIMDLNALKRDADGSWNPDNARELLQFSAARDYRIAGFEFGNEYDLYEWTFRTSVSPEQLTKDIQTLQNLLQEFPEYYSAFIIGPEVAHLLPDDFQRFLAAGGADLVRAASFHFYYFADNQTNPDHFTDVATMDLLTSSVVDPALTEARAVDPQLPVWLSETSSTYNFGVPDVSDRFVAGFLWLDKLGVCAVRGVQTVIRQEFRGYDYSLLDQDSNPKPDYWLTLLYKRILRGPVFNVTAPHDVRVYSACANPDTFSLGSLVVYMLNPNDFPVTFDLPQFTSQPRMIYSLTGWGGDRLSRYTGLNGEKLELVDDLHLPPLEPQLSPPGHVTAPPYSFTFVVFNEARVSICMEPH